MKKLLLISFGILLFYPLLLVLVYTANNIYAMSLRSMFIDVRHPSGSTVIAKDWSVANCGAASNQCCYTYVEFRSTSESVPSLEKWYADRIGETDLRKTKEFSLFLVNDDWRAQPMHAFFNRKYDELFNTKSGSESIYGIAYIESGYPAGLDFRCH